MVLAHFGRSRPEFGSLITLHDASRCLVACKGGGWGLSRFGGIWCEKSAEKRSVHSGPKDASSAYLFFIRVRVTVRVRARVRVRVTELVSL